MQPMAAPTCVLIIRVSGCLSFVHQENHRKAKTNTTSRVSPRRRGTLLLLRQKKVPKEKATRSASNSRPSHAAQGAAGTCGALPSHRCGQPTAYLPWAARLCRLALTGRGLIGFVLAILKTFVGFEPTARSDKACLAAKPVLPLLVLPPPNQRAHGPRQACRRVAGTRC